MRKRLILLTSLILAVAGCKVDPSPPSVEDAIVTWHNIFQHSHLDNTVIQLVDLKQTDGQFAEVNGIKVYTLFYEAREKYLTKMGNWKPGDD